MSLIKLIVARGVGAIDDLPEGIRGSAEAVAETIENNVRKLIIDESPINPKYYERMSQLLDALIDQRQRDAVSYKEYLDAVVQLARDSQTGPVATAYPASLDTAAKRALYDNLGSDEATALRVDAAVRQSLQDGWRDNPLKTRRVAGAIRDALASSSSYGDAAETPPDRATRVLALVTSQSDY